MNGTTHVDDDGLRIPPEVRDFERQIVIRTPASTIQHFGSDSMQPYYPMVSTDDFGDADSFRNPRNPDLAPDRVSIKREGEDAVVYTVDTDE